MSVYALHMMILYYLQESGQISRIAYSNDKKCYDFELINSETTLYDNLVGFLTFYSSNGIYKQGYAFKHFIDIVQRTPDEESKVVEMMEKLAYKIESEDSGYLFAFIHPMTNELIQSDN